MNVWMIMSGYAEAKSGNTGAELQAQTLLKELSGQGHNITVVAKKHTLRSAYHEHANGVEIFRVGPPGLRSIITALLLLWHRRRIDVVHIHGQDSLGVLAVALCHLLGIASVLKITIAGRVFIRTPLDKLLPRKWRLFRRLVNKITRTASAYIAISQEIADELVRAKFHADRIVRLANGVDTGRFHAVDTTTKTALRQQFGLPTDKPLVLYSSRLIARKGFDLLLKAWPEISTRNPEAHLVIVGGGKAEATAAIAQLIKDCGPENVTYIGEVPNTAPYLQCADIFVFPSRKEGLPNALLEAMACGCACVASDIGGCVDLVVPNETGLLFPCGDAAAMAKQVQLLLSNMEPAQRLGEKAAAFVAQHYDIKAVATSIAALYQRLYCSKAVQIGKDGLSRTFSR